MASSIHQRDDEVMSSINIVPFVDIVLVLLIIFMVTSTAIVKAAIRVDLPQAASAGSKVESTLNLVVTKDLELVLDGTPMTKSAAAATIAARAKENKSVQAVISADKGLAYGDVVEIIDLVKMAGVSTFALNIERKQVATREE